VQPHPTLPDRFQLLRDDALLSDAASHDELLPLLEWAIATAGVEHLGRRYLLFHAGAVTANGQGLLLPGGSGSGKSTLVAGLLAAGFGYLSDEVAVVAPTTGQVLPFAKSVCVKAGARPVLAPLYPQLARTHWRHRFGPELVAFLPPPAGCWATEPVALRFVVLPRYAAGAATRLEPIARSAAAAVLLEQSFNVRALGPGAVRRTLELLSGADCFELTMGDLRGAVQSLRDLVAAG
jgi:HprK-related kinase A